MINGTTLVTPCMGCCPHTYQDRKYGVRVRVHNVGGKDGAKTLRCTVCGRTK